MILPLILGTNTSRLLDCLRLVALVIRSLALPEVDRKSRLPIVGTGSLRPSLPGPCHRPSGTDPSPAMTSASATSAHATRARLTLHLLVVVGRWRSRAFAACTPLAVAMGDRPLINPNTQCGPSATAVASLHFTSHLASYSQHHRARRKRLTIHTCTIPSSHTRAPQGTDLEPFTELLPVCM